MQVRVLFCPLSDTYSNTIKHKIWVLKSEKSVMFWGRSSNWESTCFASRGLRVQVPSVPVIEYL